MAKHLRICGVLLPFLFLCVPALHADTYSPTYQFIGIITVTGNNPTCGSSPDPCVETIGASFEYYYDIPPGSLFPGENCFDSIPEDEGGGCVRVVVLPGSTVIATGELGPLEWSGFMINVGYSYYSEFTGPSDGAPFYNEIDLDIDPETNTFYAQTYFLSGDSASLFGYGGIGTVPTTLEYVVGQLPEPSVLSLVLLGILGLATLQFRRRLSLPS